jgi:hypothetical protein
VNGHGGPLEKGAAWRCAWSRLARLIEFASKAFVLPAELLDLGAELLQLLKDGEGHGHRVEHLD